MKYTYTRYWGIFTVPGEAPGAEKLVGYGYSGAVMALNDIHKSNIEMVGPLPAGTYVIENVYDDSRRGNHTCVLRPHPDNKMYGRSGFLIHGDTLSESHNASDGCIITTFAVRSMFMAQDIIEVV